MTSASDTLRELRELILKLSLVSHAPTRPLDAEPRRNAQGMLGGNRPPGDAREFPHGSEEHHDYLVAFKQKDAGYFEQRIVNCRTQRELESLRDEAQKAYESWKRTKLAPGNLPVWGTPECDEYIVNNHRGLTQRQLGDLWGKSHVAIGNVQRRARSSQPS